MVTTIPTRKVHSGTFRDLDDTEMLVLEYLVACHEADPDVPIRTDVIEEHIRTNYFAPCIDRIMMMCEAGYVGETDDRRSVAVLREGISAFNRQRSPWKERVALGVRHYNQETKKNEMVYDYDANTKCVLSPQGREALLRHWKLSVPTATEDQIATASHRAGVDPASADATLPRDPTSPLPGTGTQSPSAQASGDEPGAPGKARPISRRP